MARLIAVEWDAREARIVVARQRAKTISFEHAFHVDLTPSESGQPVSETDIGDRIGAALAARGISRGDVLVTVGRTSIELRQLALPPSPLEELPDLVRFQAMRQFANIGEGWPLDFAHIHTDDASEFNVLAAAISPTLVEQIQRTCEAAGLTPRHLVLRPFPAASLVRRFDPRTDNQCWMIVDPLAVEADLTVLLDEQVGFMRTVRLPEGDAAYQSKGLLAEVRRTIVAAQNQLDGRRVDRIVLCGDEDDHAALKQQLEEALSLPVELFDPFDGLTLEGDLAKRLPPHHGRFLPLLGMLLDEATGTRHAIDFLHPTERPQPPNQRRRIALIATAVALLLLAVGGGFWLQLHRLDAKIRQLTIESNNLDNPVNIAAQRRKDVAAVEEFLAADITWLEELRQLSLAFPPPEQAMIQTMNANERPRGPDYAGGGEIGLEVLVSESSVVERLERQLRDERHRVSTTGVRSDSSGKKNYPVRVPQKVIIEPEDHTRRFESPVTESTPSDGASDAAEPVPGPLDSASSDEDFPRGGNRS